MAHILVIGGAGGLGSAVVHKLLARGDQVSVSVLNEREAASVREATPGVQAIHTLDMSDAVAVRGALSSALANGPALDGVVVCAAIAPLGPLETTGLDVIRRTIEINCVSDIAIFQAALPALRKTRGRLVFVSSMAGIAAMPFIGAYVTSKFALEGAADVMRQEAAPQGVKVVLVEPGGIKTPMVSQQLEEVAARLKSLDGEERQRYGYLYRGFEAAASQGHNNDSSTPEQIADVVIAALDAEAPEARYAAGPDAEQLIALARSGDAQLDAAMAGMFGSPDA